MQVANDVASANELPSREARPGRRVSNSAAGKLQGGELRKDCVEGVRTRWRRARRLSRPVLSQIPRFVGQMST